MKRTAFGKGTVVEYVMVGDNVLRGKVTSARGKYITVDFIDPDLSPFTRTVSFVKGTAEQHMKKVGYVKTRGDISKVRKEKGVQDSRRSKHSHDDDEAQARLPMP